MGLNNVQYYEAGIRAIDKELRDLPDGALAKYGPYYYEIHGAARKGITRDAQRVRQLARKAFLLKKRRHFECNLLLAKEQSRRYMTEEPIEMIRELPPSLRELPAACFLHPSVPGWLNSDTVEDIGFEDGLIYLTNSGIRVRSKSERTIADALDQNGIPYLYEAGLMLGGEIRYPDFTIRRPFDEKVFLWEHFGRMDQEDYRNAMTRKMSLYARYGYISFDNLICTFEHDLLDVTRIQRYIELFLLCESSWSTARNR